MRRATVILSLLCVVLGPITACGDTGDSKLSNGQDLPPGTQVDGGGVDGTIPVQNDDSGSVDDSGSMSEPDTGTQDTDSGSKPKDSGSTVDSSFDAGHD